MLNIIWKLKYLPLLGLIGFLFSCNTEDIDVNERHLLSFQAFISDSKEIKTREGLNIKTVTNAEFDTPFYIRMETGGDNIFGKYQVQPGMEGQLSTMEGTPLNWKTSAGDHTFWGWTLPWDPSYKPGNDSEIAVHFDPKNEIYKDFQDKDILNCAILEKFIGTKAGPVNYQDNGEYVELQFKHLVSKIEIGSLTLITSTGTSIKGFRGTITFYGMNKSALFYPSDDSFPHLEFDENVEKDVTYDLGSNAVFYICPETDFSNLNFRIHLNDYSQEGDYFGDFSQVIFNRTEIPDWDENKESTVLYAGEVMILNLTLVQGHGVGVTITINDWNQTYGKGSSYWHKGIYNDGEAQDLCNLFGGEYTPQEAKELFDLYGDEFDGKKVFPIYEDIDINQINFPMDKDYVIDGMGHTVKLTPRTTGNNPHTVRIGPCRDIFITDGEYTVYIDEEGNIFQVNEDGSMTQKGKLPDLKDNQYSYSIDLSTGSVSGTTQK